MTSLALSSLSTALAAGVGAVYHRHPAAMDAALSDVYAEIIQAAAARHRAPPLVTRGAAVLLPIAGRVVRVAVSSAVRPSRWGAVLSAAASTGAVALAADRWMAAAASWDPKRTTVVDGEWGAWG